MTDVRDEATFRDLNVSCICLGDEAARGSCYKPGARGPLSRGDVSVYCDQAKTMFREPSEGAKRRWGLLGWRGGRAENCLPKGARPLIEGALREAARSAEGAEAADVERALAAVRALPTC